MSLRATFASLVFSMLAAIAFSGCPGGGNGSGGGGGSGGGNAGGTGGGDMGGGGGDDGGFDASVPDAGTCVKVELGAVDSSGYPLVKLATGSQGAFWASLGGAGLDVVRYSGGAFEAPAHLADAGALSEHALAASDSDAVLAWTQTAVNGGELHYARYDGTSWSLANVTTRAAMPQYPSVASAGGRALLVWNEGPQIAAQLFFQRYASGAWENPARLDTLPDGGASSATATADQTGPIAFWGQPTADAGVKLYVADLPATGSPSVASGQHGGYVIVATANHMGDALALVQQGNSALYARPWSRNGGLQPDLQPTVLQTSALLSVALTDDNRGYATWTDGTNHPTGASLGSSGLAWIPFTPPDTGNALVATDGTRVVQVSLGAGSGKLHFLFFDPQTGWSSPLELPAGIQVTALDALAFTSTGALALDVAGTVSGGAPTNYAVVCH